MMNYSKLEEDENIENNLIKNVRNFSRFKKLKKESND